MTNSNAAITDSTSSAAGFLSSLTSSLGAGGGLSSLFESLLEATQTAIPSATANTVTPATTSGVSGTGSDPSTNNQAYVSLTDIFSALHDFGVKWGTHSGNSQQNNTQNSTGGQQSGAAAASTPSSAPTSASSSSGTSGSGTSASSTASTGSSTGTQTSSSMANSTPATGSAPNSSGTSNAGDASDSNSPPSLTNLLAELQAILQMLQKQIQLAQNGTGSSGDTTTDANGSAANTQGIQDLLAAGGALSDLLALAQKLENNLGISSAGSAQTAGTGTGSVDPALAALDTQLRTNLQTLVGNLQTAVAANAANTGTGTGTGTGTNTTIAAAVTTDTGLLTDTVTTPDSSTTGNSGVSASTAPAPATPGDIIKSALATADDFLKQLNNLYAPSNVPAFTAAVAANSVTPAGAGDGSSPDANADGGGANSTANAQGVTQDTTLQGAAVDTTKTSNPYSFASQLSALRALNGGTVGLPSAVEQVLLLLNKNARSGNDQMSVQLHPADLGSINVKLDFASDGTVSGTVVASNADTLAMLQKDSRSLERALQDAGLRTDPGSLQFSLGDPSNPNNSGQAQNQTSGDTTSGATSSGLAALVPDSDLDTADSWIITPNRVNIQV